MDNHLLYSLPTRGSSSQRRTEAFLQTLAALSPRGVRCQYRPRHRYHGRKRDVAGSSYARTPALGPSRVKSGGICVLVADESRMGCELLEGALKRSHCRLDVVACAVTSAEIFKSLDVHNIDVALINEHLEDGRFRGFQVLREFRASQRKTGAILLFVSLENDLVVDAFRAGARGVFCRTEPVESLCKCIQAVHSGQLWASNDALQLILGSLANAPALRVVGAHGRTLLAKREDQVVNLVADGLTNREISVKLDLSEHTVSNYLFRIYNKLGISRRIELVLYVMTQRRRQHQELWQKSMSHV